MRQFNQPLIVPLFVLVCNRLGWTFGLQRASRSSDTVRDCDSDISEDEILRLIHGRYASAHKLPRKVGPTKVSVELHIQDISALSESTGGFCTNLLFSQVWLDGNLNFSQLKTCKKNITLGPKFLEQIWTPNACIVNSKDAELHKSPTDNLFVILYQNGTVWVNYRIKASGPCDLDLRMFPFDSQTCNLALESYSYNSEEVSLVWFPEALTFFPKAVQLPDFDLLTWKVKKTTPVYPNGQWDRLEVTFTFQRRYEFYILQAYIPTYIIIVSSWISFCMDHKILPARTTLSVSALLAITFQYGNIIRNLPKVSYIKAMDVWMLACVSFVFGALLELAVIALLSRQVSLPQPEPKRPSRRLGRHLSLLPSYDNSASMACHVPPPFAPQSHYANGYPHSGLSHMDTVIHIPQKRKPKSLGLPEHFANANTVRTRCLCLFCFCPISPNIIDRAALFLFPSAFLLFNICYWCYYIGMMKSAEEMAPDSKNSDFKQKIVYEL